MKDHKRGRPRGTHTRYAAIAANIARRLAAGEWQVGRKMPSLREFARIHRVSIKTIHRAFAILKADGRLQIRPRRVAVVALGFSLKAMLDNAIVVISPHDLANSWQGKIWTGVVQSAQSFGSALIVLQYTKRFRSELPAGLFELPLSGVLLLGPFRPNLLRQYEASGLPVVLLDQPGDEYRFHSVSIANHEAAFDATSRLIALGHRRIAFIAYILPSLLTIEPDAKERQMGFVAACRQAGLKENEYRTFVAANDNASQSIQELLRATHPFTAVITAYDKHAEQVAAASKAEGLRIPQDLSIVTFRGPTAHPLNWSGPQLDLRKFGQIGVEILHRKPKDPQHVHVSPMWHDGDTLGLPSKRSSDRR